MKTLELVFLILSFILAVVSLTVALVIKVKIEYVYWLVILSAILLIISRIVHKKFPKTHSTQK